MGVLSATTWMTQCLHPENDLEKVLVLAKSLRNVMTRAAVTVIIGGNVSSKDRAALELVFDSVVVEPRCEQLTGFLSSDEIGQLFALSLQLFKKIIYVNPDTFFIRNCDHLFTEEYTKNDNKNGGNLDQVPFLVKPSYQDFSQFFKILVGSRNEEGIRENDKMGKAVDYLAPFFQNNAAVHFNRVSDPCWISLNLQEMKIHENMEQLGIIHLKDLGLASELGFVNGDDFPKAGILEKEIYNRWLEMRQSVQGSNLISLPKSNLNENEKIAVVGMSCRFPKSNNLSEFWDLLIGGKDGTGLPPAGRWTKEKSHKYFPESEKMNAGFLSVAEDKFDSKFFGISPKEVAFMDPQLRILMEVVWESLEHAGINPQQLYGSKGSVFLGTWKSDYRGIVQRASTDLFRTYMGSTSGPLVARVAHFLGLKGPCLGTESDCSAGMMAVHMACNSLRIGESSMAFACGANLLVEPFDGNTVPNFFSKDGLCKTFDESADGFGRADGCGVLVLKRYSDAIRDGDKVWGLIRGSAVTQEGMSNSIGTPTVACEGEVMKKALLQANVHPAEVSYVEAHGTGTALGDPVEIQAIEHAYGTNERPQKLVIGSVKTNIGHTEACSGIAGIIKVLLSMWNEQIPPHRNLKKLNPKIHLDSIPALIPMEVVPWKRSPENKRIAGISSFGVAGVDVHLIMEEPDTSTTEQDQKIIFQNYERPLHILQLSAKTDNALNELLSCFQSSLQANQSENLADIAFTANTGKASLPHKAVVIAKDVSSALSKLNSGKYLTTAKGTTKDSPICFLFTGQGSQYLGMARQLYETSPIFQMHFDFCENFLQTHYNLSLKQVYFSDKETDSVNRTIYSQTGIFVVEVGLIKLWQSWGIQPDFVLGHSLGEFAAAVCAGILSIEDALKLVVERSSLIDNLPQGKMLVIKADKPTVDKYQVEFGSNLDYAATNTNDQTVVAGDIEEVTKFAEFLERKSIKNIFLQSSHAFHSKHMDPMLSSYRKVAQKISYNSPQNCQFISGMMGKAVTEVSANYWVRHTREAVNFLEASKLVCQQFGCKLFLEVGPQPILSSFILMNNPEEMKDLLCLPSLRRKEENWETLLTSIGKLSVEANLEINWEGLDRHYNRLKCGHLLPSYPFQRTKTWMTPEDAEKDSKIVTPLLGSLLRTPTDSTIFKNVIHLKNLPYLRDHLLDFILFPCAGYMEMLLSASFFRSSGLSSKFSFPTRPVSLESFKIFAPLALTEEENGATMQVVVDSTSAKVYHLEESQDTWVHHASGSFSLHNNQDEVDNAEALFLSASNDSILEAFSVLKSSTKDEDSNLIQTLLRKQLKVGFKFGPTFQILSNAWRSEEKFLAEISVDSLKSSSKQSTSHLLHPTIIDAMIQVAIFSRSLAQNNNSTKLPVPVGCRKFIWFNELKPGKSCYIYSNTNTEEQSAILIDSDGTLIAALLGIETVLTKLGAIKAACEAQVKTTPDFYKTEWTESLQFPEDNKTSLPIESDGVELLRQGNIILPQQPADLSLAERHRLILLNVFQTFQRLRWSPAVNEEFTLKGLTLKLGVNPSHMKLIRLFLQFLSEEGYLSPIKAAEKWSVLKSFPSTEQITQEVSSLLQKSPKSSKYSFIQSVSDVLHDILVGKKSPLDVLYPQSSKSISVDDFYTDFFSYSRSHFKNLIQNQLQSLAAQCKQSGSQLPTLKILEIGAGSGSFSEVLLEELEKASISFEFLYTDVASTYFSNAKQKLQKHEKSVKYQKLDIEKDPIAQGFAPHYFDIIIAAHVLHATKDIRESLQNTRRLLRDGGNLLLSETTETDILLDFTLGSLESYWSFTDAELRGDYPLLPVSQWKSILSQSGFDAMDHISQEKFSLIVSRADTLSKGASSYPQLSKSLSPSTQAEHLKSSPSWLLFFQDNHDQNSSAFLQQIQNQFTLLGRKQLFPICLSQCPETSTGVHYANITSKLDMDNLFSTLFPSKNYSAIEGIIFVATTSSETNQDLIGKPYLYLLQNLVAFYTANLKPKCILLTNNQFPVMDSVCENPSGATLIGMSKTILNERQDAKLKIIDANFADTNSDLLFQEILEWTGEEPTFLSCLRGSSKFIPKFTQTKVTQGALPIPNFAERFQIILPESKTVSDLTFGAVDMLPLKPNEIEVKVKCYSLNFRDLFSVWKPAKKFESFNSVGLEYSGVVCRIGKDVTSWKVGDPVFGSHVEEIALPSHVRVYDNEVVQIPPSMTFAEASLPLTAFITAYYSLIETAKAQKGETVLIHTASGGVGLIAIQICKHYGLNVICTAGSNRKRAYLRSLGIQHIFNSRSLEFTDQIMEVTNGKGVDMVINTLTGPGFKEATLAACSEGARFLEISKFNIWDDEDVQKLRPDVKYSIVDVDLFRKRLHPWMLLNLKIVNEWFLNGQLKPIPYTIFEASQIREAMGFLQKAKHIGKVVVSMPDSTISTPGNSLPLNPLFNDRSTYLITGGLGEIGTEVCKYMASQGARHFVLMGRSAPSAKAQALFQNLKEDLNCSIHITQGDIGNFSKCQEIINWIESDLPPLRGIMHVAGTLSDGLLENVSWDNFGKTFNPKVYGSWNLHQLTKHLVLEHFVLFSSIMSQVGLAGHGSHCSACSFQDIFANFRNSHGLTTTNINWGQWAEIGSGTEAEFSIVKSFSSQQAIKSLDYILRENRNHVLVSNMQEFSLPQQKYIDWFLNSGDGATSSQSKGPSETKTNAESITFWKNYESCESDKAKKLQILKDCVTSVIKNVLRLEEDEQVDEVASFMSMGMDSLMIMEAQNVLQILFGKRTQLPSALLKDFDSLKLLTEKLLQIFEGDEKVTEKKAVPTLEQVWELVQKDTMLPEHIQVENPGSETKPSEIKNLILTGSTGHYGPHMLKQLLEGFPQLEKVYCLIRGKDPLSKLQNVLTEKKITFESASLFTKVIPIKGDISLPKLGLSDDLYSSLLSEIDAVIHLASKINFTEYYTEGNPQDVRNTNVGGLLNILSFAATTKTKHVFNASTIAASNVTSPDGCLIEDWPTLDIAHVYSKIGYSCSKYVCDRLLKEAVESRGIPCKCFRHAELRESTYSQATSTKNVFTTRLILHCMKAGVAPQTQSYLQYLPVDTAAKLATSVFFQDTAPNTLYYVTHPSPVKMTEQFLQVAKELNFPMEAIPLEDYRQLVLTSFQKTDDSIESERFARKNYSFFQNLFQDKTQFTDVMDMCPKNDHSDTFRSHRLSQLVPQFYSNLEPNVKTVARDVIVAIKSGYFD